MTSDHPCRVLLVDDAPDIRLGLRTLPGFGQTRAALQHVLHGAT